MALVTALAGTARIEERNGHRYYFQDLGAGRLQAEVAPEDVAYFAADANYEVVGLVGNGYETVAANQTDQVLGATGAAGDYLESLVCVVATAATSQVQIKDGAGSAITVLPNNVGAGVGTVVIRLGVLSSNGAWKVSTGAGVSVVAVGKFT